MAFNLSVLNSVFDDSVARLSFLFSNGSRPKSLLKLLNGIAVVLATPTSCSNKPNNVDFPSPPWLYTNKKALALNVLEST